MIVITTTDQIEKIIRDVLIKQSGLSGAFVRNSLSTYGIALNKDISTSSSEAILDSIGANDCLLLFELQSRESNDDVSMTELDGKVTYYRALRAHCILYGNSSTTLATKIAARLRTQKNQNDMYNQGLHFNSCSSPDTINEFINGAMWIRNDFNLNFGCKFEITQIDDNYNFAEVKENIIEYEKETNA